MLFINTNAQVLTRWYEDYVNPKYSVSQPSVESIEPSHFEGSIKHTSKTIKETPLIFISKRIPRTTKTHTQVALNN